MNIDDTNISPELKEKAKVCKTPEEILALAKKEGYKLSEGELEGVAGGGNPWALDSTEYLECVRCGTKYEITAECCPGCGLKNYGGPDLEY